MTKARMTANQTTDSQETAVKRGLRQRAGPRVMTAAVRLAESRQRGGDASTEMTESTERTGHGQSVMVTLTCKVVFSFVPDRS